MTRKEFADFVLTVNRTYCTETFVADQETFDTWYSYFADYKYSDLDDVFKQHALNNRCVPKISDLIPKLKKAKADTNNEIYHYYSELEFVWIGSVSMDCLDKFKEVCRGNANWAKSLSVAGKLRTKKEPGLTMSDWLDQQERRVVEWMQNRQ